MWTIICHHTGGWKMLRSFQGILQPRWQKSGVIPLCVEVGTIFVFEDCEIGKSLLARVDLVGPSPQSKVLKCCIQSISVSSGIVSTAHRSKKMHVKEHSPKRQTKRIKYSTSDLSCSDSSSFPCHGTSLIHLRYGAMTNSICVGCSAGYCPKRKNVSSQADFSWVLTTKLFFLNLSTFAQAVVVVQLHYTSLHHPFLLSTRSQYYVQHSFHSGKLQIGCVWSSLATKSSVFSFDGSHPS